MRSLKMSETEQLDAEDNLQVVSPEAQQAMSIQSTSVTWRLSRMTLLLGKHCYLRVDSVQVCSEARQLGRRCSGIVPHRSLG